MIQPELLENEKELDFVIDIATRYLLRVDHKVNVEPLLPLLHVCVLMNSSDEPVPGARLQRVWRVEQPELCPHPIYVSRIQNDIYGHIYRVIGEWGVRAFVAGFVRESAFIG